MRTFSIICAAGITLLLAATPGRVEPALGETPSNTNTAPPAFDISRGFLVGDNSELEARVLKALSEPTEFAFANTPLSEVANYLETRHNIEVELDSKALEEAGVATTTPITRKLKGISLRSALRLVLRDLDLTFVIRDEVLLITTTATAETIPTTRIYPLGDWFDTSDSKNLITDASDDIIDVIVGAIAPTTWSEAGGAGSIQYLSEARSLVISQTSEIHEEVRDFLIAMRKAQSFERTRPQETVADGGSEKLFVEFYRLNADLQNFEVVANGTARDPGSKDTDKTEPPKLPRVILVSNRALADAMALAIPRFVDPPSWQANGGQGSVESVGVGLLVRQTRRIHRELSRLLRSAASPKFVGGGTGAGGGMGISGGSSSF